VSEDLAGIAAAAARGDSEAFASLVAATHSEVWRLCAYLVDRESADDLTQDTYVRACRSLRTLRDESGIRTWLLILARRTCAAEIDRRVRQREIALRVRSTAPVEYAPDHGGESDVRVLISQLAPERRHAFVLTQLVGCDYAEAAEICGVPLGTIRSRVARAREDLIAALAGDVREPRSMRHN
jgi:RNA polymerase sigma-70 factor (ECF subfamily)